MNITWTSGNIKALGIYLGNDHPEVLLIKEIYDKMETSTKFWNSFYLAKFAKARVLEIFISSKLCYAAKFIAIPTNYQVLIQKLFNDFIKYPNTRNLIAQNELYKLREDGGIKLINIQIKALASKIKWLSEVIADDRYIINKEIIDKLIGKQPHNYYGLDSIFIASNNILKNVIKITSPFYREIVKKIADLYPRRKKTDIEQQNVLFNYVFVNKNDFSIIKSPYLINLNKTGIKTYGDLRAEKQKQTNGISYNKCLVKIFDRIVVDEDEGEVFDSVELYQNGEINRVNMKKVKEKEIYTTLIKKTYKDTHISETTWQEHFSNNLNYSHIWINLKNKFVLEGTRTYIWEQIHLNYYTTAWFNKITDKQDPCPLCMEIPKDKKHLIIDCNIVKILWSKIDNTLQKLVDVSVDQKEMVFGLTANNLKTEEKLRNWVTFKLRETIGKHEKTFHENHQNINSITRIKNDFNKQIQKEITYMYQLYKKQNKLNLLYLEYNSKFEMFTVENDKVTVKDLMTT